MIPILFGSDYDRSDHAYSSHGLGDLTDAISCFVDEERNGCYELEMKSSMDGIHFEDISLRKIILAKPNFKDDPQPFRIYKITKPIDGICTIYARHISYDMSFIAVTPFTAANIGAALSGLKAHALNDCPFTLSTTRSTAAPFKVDATSSMRSWLGGKEGSLLDVYGGEWHFDRFTATLENHRGADRGVVINYGKNLLELEQEEEEESTFTGCVAIFIQDDVETRGDIQYVDGFTYEKVYVLDVSSEYDSVPTKAQLNARAAVYLEEHKIPSKNIVLDFVQSEKLAERVDLCDTVTIKYEDLGVSASAKCIRTKWNVLLERYEETEFGDARTSLADTISQTSKAIEAVPTKSEMEKAVDRATALISGNLGGYVILNDSDGDGYPDEILIMNTPDINTATNVWRYNKNGWGHSSNGYNGPYAMAATLDGGFIADFITAGTMLANRIKGGTLTLGGAENGNGVLQVLNANGDVIGTWNNAGISGSGAFRNVFGDEWIQIYQSLISGGSTAGHTDGTLDLSANLNGEVWTVLRAITGYLQLVSNTDDVRVQAHKDALIDAINGNARVSAQNGAALIIGQEIELGRLSDNAGGHPVITGRSGGYAEIRYASIIKNSENTHFLQLNDGAGEVYYVALTKMSS